MTWNVLHRVHAENYSEPMVALWPDETARVKAISALVLKAITEDACDVVLLQEVSGDVLNEVRHRLPSSMGVSSHQVPRVPAFKRPSRTMMVDASEHVVVIADAGLTSLRAVTAQDDAGKGSIAAQLRRGVIAVSTHVSWGTKGTAQLTTLRELMAELPGTVLIGGDFNAERHEVMRCLGEGLQVSELVRSATRLNPGGHGSTIDHLIARGGTWSEVSVTEQHGLSDHLPLIATLTVSEGA